MATPTIFGSIDETARRRFEAAWRAGTPKPIDEFLPPAEDPLYSDTLEELVLIELEFAWRAVGGLPRAGSEPPQRVEHYLTRFPLLNTPAALARLVREEFVIRQLHGDRPSVAEYRDRFPMLSTVVAALETAAPTASVPIPYVAAHSVVVAALESTEPNGLSPEERSPTIDGYEVTGVLGRGGMGIVYEAREHRLGRAVALKTTRGTGSAELRARFLAEARVAARLEHPGVVPVHELVTPPAGEPFYTMKLVRGHTLEEAVCSFHAQRPGSERTVARRRLLDQFLAVVQTMAFAHQRGVVHRDLKPANVVLGEFGETVVLDWGLAKVLRDPEPCSPGPTTAPAAPDLTATGDVLGTPAYMAPEQAAGRPAEVDERTDIYALGAILYHILTGGHPHRGAGADLFRFIQEREPVLPSVLGESVPRPLEAICLKAMAKAKTDRYSTARALADDVERFLAGEPVSVYRERPYERFARWARRHRTLVATGTVAVILTVVGVGAMLYLRERADHERREREIKFQAEQEQERQRVASDKRDAVRRAAQTELARGLAELQAGRFSLAEQTLQQAAAALPADADIPERDRLSDLRRAAGRLAAFTRNRERADVLALGTDDFRWNERDEATVTACEAGLHALGVFGGTVDWWNHLPDGDLLDHQRRRLREDASAALGLLAMWRTKRGVARELHAETHDLAAADYRGALDLLGRVQGFVRADTRRRAPTGERGSPAAAVLEFFCRLRLKEDPVPPQLPLVVEDAPDLYFLGTAHLFLAYTPPDTRTGPFTSNMVETAKRLLLGKFPKLGGMDFDTPLVTAERQLRAAAALDPGYHMTHYWLGRCLMYAKDYAGAEQAFNACIALRPGYAPAYTARTDALLIEAQNTPAPKPTRPPADLRDLALRGLAASPESVREEPEVVWAEARCLSWVRPDDAGPRGADAAEREVARQRGITSGPQSVAGAILDYEEKIAKVRPDRPEVWADVAIAALAASRGAPGGEKAASELAASREAQARRESARVLAVEPNNPRARGVRGMLRLKTGDAAGALGDFDAALAVAPRSELAGLGRAWALEQLGDWEAALRAHSASLPSGATGTGPQHLQPHLGRARALTRLGRPDEARRALAAAREIDPVAAEALAAILLPEVVREE